ncbi:MAG: cell division protein SepF [Candidatus Bilamarchaeaceae archaeon]
MGFFDKMMGKPKTEEVPDLGELLNSEGSIESPPADFYVKRIDLRNEGDADLVLKELGVKNVIILNIMPLSKQPNRLKGIIQKLKMNASKADGDIALLSQTTILLTPGKVKIVKSKQKAAPAASSDDSPFA